ncbi:flagellar brake protein [Clostridium sp.]|uniref:flagellar brake protein n=1 Tax=Clostridium sp. TaxID=1506 RepID=UPI003D6D3A30
MDTIVVENIRQNDIVKFINSNKSLVDGQIIKVSNDCLGIKIDIRQNTYIELVQNQLIELILVYENEALRCSSVVLGSKKIINGQVIIISLPQLILRIQRREFERLPIIMDIEYSLLPEGDINYKSLSSVERRYFKSFKKTYTIDISAGGVNIVVPKNEIDSKFALVTLLLRNEKIITLCSKIRLDSMDDYNYNKVVFKYEDIKKQDRQLILDFVSAKSKKNKS